MTLKDSFRAVLPKSIDGVKKYLCLLLEMNDVLYGYFKSTYGIVDTMHQPAWKENYEPTLKKDLTSCLRTLKRNQASFSEIQYVSPLLKSKSNQTPVSDVDDHIKRNFWEYVKQGFNNKVVLSPTFNTSICTEFVGKFFATINPLASITIPSWISSPSQLFILCDSFPPIY